MVGLGSVQQFDINENILSSDNINKKMTDLSYQEFQFKVKEVVDSGWKRLLINAIIENCAEKSFAGCGPVLNGGLCFDHQNHYQSPKWSQFGQASFVLPRIQLTDKAGDTYITINTIITKSDGLEYEMQLIDEQIISLLQFCNELLNGEKQYSSLPIDPHYHTEIDQTSLFNSETWKQTVHQALNKINDGDFQKLVLPRQIQLKRDQQNINYNVACSLMRLYPSSYLFAVLKQGTCFFGATPTQLIRLHQNQFHADTLTNTTDDRHSYSLILQLIKTKFESITEPNSLVLSDTSIASLQGTIKKGITLLDLVQTLHPTPLLQELTQPDKLKFIQEKQKFDCGWFSAPVGWIDSNNNGQFVAGIESALINEDSLSLFAHCDIPPDYKEEDLFQQTIFNIKTIFSILDDK
jgi:menaquinone-specific isochorismate synthase